VTQPFMEPEGSLPRSQQPALSPNILLSTLFSNTLNLCSSFSVTDHVSPPYKTKGKIIVDVF